MAEYIVSMDPSTHADASAAETAITSAGGTILKTYGFNMTYKIEAEEAEKDAINGVLHHEGYDREAVITPSFNTNHLKMLCNDAGSTSTAYTYRSIWKDTIINVEDVYLAEQLAKKFKFKHHVIDIDLFEFYNNNEHYN